jgi:hypothetical protein
MIVIQINGGLGNQLFTYARGYSLAKKNNLDLVLDDYIYRTGYKWHYELNNYNISYKRLFINIHYNNIPNLLYKIVSRLKRKLLCKVINEPLNYVYHDYKIDTQKNYYFAGYWQAFEYFDEYKKELKEEFTLTNIRDIVAIIAKEIKDGCAVHVRRGDYSTYKGGKIISDDYYKDALLRFQDFYPNSKIVVFSDDINYCKKIFVAEKRVRFISSPYFSNKEELYLMSCCKHFIIANSSFSWWGAYLGEKEDSIIFCPVVDQWKDGFYPTNWIKILANLA